MTANTPADPKSIAFFRTLGRGLELYASNIFRFTALTLMLMLPVGLLLYYCVVVIGRGAVDNRLTLSLVAGYFMADAMVTAIVSGVAWSSRHDRPASVFANTTALLKRSPSFVLVTTLQFAIVVAGTFLLIVPGFFAHLILWVAPAVWAAERAWPWTSLWRSGSLILPSFFKVLVIALIFAGLLFTVGPRVPSWSYRAPALFAWDFAIVLVVTPLRASLVAAFYIALRGRADEAKAAVVVATFTGPRS